MATPSSEIQPVPGRVDLRRRRVRDEALHHALDVMAESGAGAVTISELARRMGMRGPSLYKYFPSLHALYDALFERGLAAESAAVRRVSERVPPGVDRLRAGYREVVRWCIANPALAQLLHWRPVPGFEPSPDVFARSVTDMLDLRSELAEAVRLGQLAPQADSDEAARLLTVLMSGLISQQMANEPGVSFGRGRFTRLTDDAFEMFLARYRPTGDDHADPRP